MMLGLRGSSQKATNPAMPVPSGNGHTSGYTNGHTNGHSTEIASINGATTNEHHSSTAKYAESRITNTDTRTIVNSSYTRTFTSAQQVTVLRHTVTTTRSKFCELSHVDDQYIDSMDVESFLEYIETERLTYMPQRGSKWDKVLKWAEFFALQVSGYENAVGSFVPESRIGAKLIWAACRLLIELGSENSQAIETAFAVFYKVGLQLKFFLRHGELLSSNTHIRMEVGQAFNDLLVLVRDVALYYRIQISIITSSQVDLDFNSLFGKSIDSFYARKDHIIEAMWACTQESESHDVHAIRKWLSVRDPVVRALLRDRAATRARHDEYTCEWIQRTLLDFSRGNSPILALTGPSGCGKSILASWIVERLQRPLGKKTHDTLFLSIDPDLPNQATSLAISKNIALQLLQSSVGDIALLKALETAFEASTSGSDAVKLEKLLWSAINIGITERNDQNLIIVMDGLDDRIPNVAKAVGVQIAELASKHAHVQVIILARNNSLLPKAMIHKFDITPDHTHNDVEHVAEHSLHGCLNFRSLKPKEQDELVDHLVKAAHGNFLTVQLIAKNLKNETTFDGFVKAIKAVEKDSSKILPQLIQGLIARETNDLNKPEAVQILSWLIIAERPLTTAEIKSLLRIDIKKKALSTGYANIDEVIRDSCGSLLSTQNNIVRFRHGSIREQLIRISAENTKIQTFHDLNAGFVTRLLTYCALRLPIQHASVFDCPETSELNHFFNQDALLEYATRNWIYHFKNSSLYRGSESFELSPEFKSAFPASVRLAAFEWLCWQTGCSTILELTILHKLALKVRETVFSEKHESVFQTLIVCGRIYKTLSLSLEAGSCFYRASRLGQTLFKGYSAITTSCSTMYLHMTESIISTTRTETVSHKEELLEYIITTHKVHFGKTSDSVIKHMKLLATLYVSIHEEHKAETIWTELRDIMVIRYGKGSSEETSVSGSLNIVIKRGERREEITEYEENIFETVTEMEIWDIRRIKIILELAVTCETRGEILKAEEHYLMLWRGVTMHCHQILSYHIDIEVHVSMIDIALEYVRFLRRHHRHEEAAGILICIWAEYEEYDFEFEVIFLRLKVVGELMRAVSLLSIAVSVFKKCWSWFKSHSLHEYTVSCQLLISETVEEITKNKTTTTTTISTSTTTTSTEVVIKEVFESSVSKTTVTSETISICRSLITFYMKNEQWSEAIKTSKRSLELIWRMVISGGGTVALPREFGAEAIEIAIRLAVCHHRSHHFHEAETIYLRIYRACFNSCQIYDERFVLGYTTLIKFYSDSGHWHKAIGVHKDILIATRKHFGANDAKTIKLLYTLGSLCHKHGHGSSYEYYEEIITILNSGSKVCHHDAFEAVQIMCQFYFEEGHWHKLQLTCEMLWETWTHHHAEYRFEAGFIELLYMRYLYVLENHCHVKYDIIRTITVQYRDVCIKAFGVFCSITVKALIALAQICMRSEKHYHEAITYYEEVIKTTTEMSKSIETSTTKTTTSTSIVSTTTISTVKQQLTKAYIHVCNHGSVSTTFIERAILVLSERFEYLKVTFGCAHIETLTVLRELILLHWTHVTKESRALVIKLLLETTILIITKEKNSRTLHEAAAKIAGIYLRCELHVEGRVMLREIHQQIVCRSYSSSDKFGFKIDSSVGKGSYVFLVTFEQLIQGSVSISYSNIMADLLTETILFESYTRCIKSEKNIEVILTAGARLFVFLHKSAWKEQSIVIRDELIKVFTKRWGTVVKSQGDIVVLFMTSLLMVLSDETSHLHIGKAACKSSNNKVRELLAEGEYNKAYGVASCAFRFIEHLGAYHHLQNVGYGFKLSSLMALRGMKPLVKPVDTDTHTKMLDLSRKIISEVLKACKDSKINFVRLKLSELNELVGLLGEQQNYSDLEWLLKSLWVSREVQKNWSPEIITGVGKRFVQALFLGEGERQKSITLCEAICYNLRRVYGALDLKALAMSELLSQVYTAAGRPKDAMRVHEDILRLVVEGDDDDDRTIDTMDAAEARKHLKLLKQTFIRAKGWDKKATVYEELVHDLINMPAYKKSPAFTGVHEVKQWKTSDQLDTSVAGDFVKPTEWEFADPRSLSENERSSDKGITVTKRHQLGLSRITSNWGMNIHLLGQKDERDEMPSPKAHFSPALNGHHGNGKYEPAILVKGPDFKPEKPSYFEPAILVKGPDFKPEKLKNREPAIEVKKTKPSAEEKKEAVKA